MLIPFSCKQDVQLQHVNFPGCTTNLGAVCITPGIQSPDTRDPITLSEDDWGVQSPPQQSI